MRGISAYKSVKKQSASPEHLLVMLYERAIHDQREAIAHLEQGDLKEALPFLQRARQIFVELTSALDPEEAPELTSNLKRLYVWCIRELIRAGREGSAEPIRATLETTIDLHSAWVEAVNT